MEKIIISASYFGINMGDEAILDAIIASIYAVKKNVKIVVMGWDRKNVLKAHEEIFKRYGIILSQELGGIYQVKELSKYFSILRSFWHLFSCDYVIFGGGGLINEEGFFLRRYLLTLKIANLFRKKSFVFAIGVNKLKEKKNYLEVATILNKSNFISVRDEESKINLAEAGVSKEIFVVTDPAFLLKTEDRIQSPDGTIKIGINLRPWFDRRTHKKEEREKMEDVLKNFSKVLIALSQKSDCEFCFFPFDKKKDAPIYENLSSLCEKKVKIYNYQKLTTPEDYLKEVGKMDLFIGMRFHSLIFSILCEVPLFAISYTEKTKNLMGSLACSENYIDINDLSKVNFNYESLTEKIIKIFQNDERPSLLQRKEIMIKKAEKNIELLNKFLYG